MKKARRQPGFPNLHPHEKRNEMTIAVSAEDPGARRRRAEAAARYRARRAAGTAGAHAGDRWIPVAVNGLAIERVALMTGIVPAGGAR